MKSSHYSGSSIKSALVIPEIFYRESNGRPPTQALGGDDSEDDRKITSILKRLYPLQPVVLRVITA